MRTRSEWFLGDGGCGEDEDGEHDMATCECRAQAAAAAADHSLRRSSALEPHDEMDCGTHLPMTLMRLNSSKRPVTQLFETTSGFGIPESEKERNGGDASSTGEHFTSNMFGTLPPINAFVACCCDVANNNTRKSGGTCCCGRSNRQRKVRSMHSYQHHEARIQEEEDGDLSSLGPSELHSFDLIADTHSAPSFRAPVTSSPYPTKKALRRGGDEHSDGNNNTVIDQQDTAVGMERRRASQLHADEKFDEIMVATNPLRGGVGAAAGEGNSRNNNKRYTRSNLIEAPNQRRRVPYRTKSHEDLRVPMERSSSRNSTRSYKKRSSRSSASLNRSQKSSNDDKLMVLFKILDFIF